MTFKLSIYDDFQCLGTDCPDNCCHAWLVEVDDTTYEKWQAIEDTSYREKLLAQVDDPDATGRRNIKFSQGQCPHLTDDNLCEIHQRLGPDALANICREYPRINEEGYPNRSLSLSPSCPQVSKMVFDKKNRLTIQMEDDQGLPFINRHLYRWLNSVIKLKEFPLMLRLGYISKTLATMVIRSEKNELEEDYFNWINKSHKKEIAGLRKSRIPPNRQVCSQFWKILLSHIVEIECRNQEQQDILQALLRIRDLEKDGVYTQLKKLYLPVTLRQWDEYFGRLLLVSLFNRGFPLMPFRENFYLAYLSGIFPVLLAALIVKMQIADGKNIFEALDNCYLAFKLIDHNRYLQKNLVLEEDIFYHDDFWLCFVDLV